MAISGVVLGMLASQQSKRADLMEQKAMDEAQLVADQEKAKYEAEQKKITDEKSAAKTVEAAKQRRRAGAAFGRGDTIITGPLGLEGQASGTGRRTLLGQ